MAEKPPFKPPSPRQIRRAARERFLKVRNAEAGFRRQLNGVGNQVGILTRAFAPGGKIQDLEALRVALQQYAQVIRPWARAVAVHMHEEIAKRDLSSWVELGRSMGRELRKEILQAPTGKAMRESLALQVDLITSLPQEAAERVHALAGRALMTSSRGEEIERMIMRTGLVTQARSRMIARTEVARTSAVLMESRARWVGSTHYVWHAIMDSDTRPTHRRLNGKVFAWDDPPVTETTGERASPGTIWNCRCWAEPLIPD